MTTRQILGRSLRLAAMAAAVLAASCVGDSGGGGTVVTPVVPPPPTMVQITPANQDAVARATVATFFTMGGVGALPTAAPTSARATARTVSAVPLYALGKAVAPAQASSSRASRLAVMSQTEQCPGGGSMTLTIDDRDGNAMLSPGDSMTFAFSQCKEDASTMMNGALAMSIATVSQSATAMQLSGAFSFQQLVIVDGSYTSSMSGVMNANYTETTDSTGTTTRLEATVTPAGFVAQGSTPTVNDTFTYDGGFVAAAIEFLPSATSTMGWSTTSLNGTVLVASLGARMTLATDPVTPVHQTSSALHPDSGQVTVLGNASRLRLTVLVTDRVRSELDASNDGTFESTKELTWTQLMP